jgi:hypothetical protein
LSTKGELPRAGAHGGEGGRRGLDIGEARPHRDQAQVGGANRRIGDGADAAGGIDDGQRHAVAREDFQPLLDFAAAGRLDARFGIDAPPLPVGQRALRVGLDEAHGVAVLHRRDGEADCKRALAAAALLGGQYDRLHGVVLRC